MEKEKIYHVYAINDKTGKKNYMTSYPISHSKCCTFISKQTKHADVRFVIEELVPNGVWNDWVYTKLSGYPVSNSSAVDLVLRDGRELDACRWTHSQFFGEWAQDGGPDDIIRYRMSAKDMDVVEQY